MAGFVGGQIGRFIGTLGGRITTAFGGTVASRGVATARTIGGNTLQTGRAILGDPRITSGAGAGARRLATRGAVIGGAGLAFQGGVEGGEALFGGGGNLSPITTIERNFGGGGGGDMPQPGMNFGTTYITRTWTTDPTTGFPFFMKLADGRIVVTRRDGSLKSYRPVKPIVLSRKPTIRQAVKAQRMLNRFRSQVKKEFGLKER